MRISDMLIFAISTLWQQKARTLLTVIDKNPTAVLTALSPASFAAAVGSSKPTTVHVRVIRKRKTSGGVTKRKTYSTEGGKRITK